MPLLTASTVCSGDEAGQSTVEFAVVAAAFLAVVLGLGALWRVASGGLFVDHAVTCASHHVQGAIAQSAADVLLY